MLSKETVYKNDPFPALFRYGEKRAHAFTLFYKSNTPNSLNCFFSPLNHLLSLLATSHFFPLNPSNESTFHYIVAFKIIFFFCCYVRKPLGTLLCQLIASKGKELFVIGISFQPFQSIKTPWLPDSLSLWGWFCSAPGRCTPSLFPAQGSSRWELPLGLVWGGGIRMLLLLVTLPLFTVAGAG